MQEKFEDAKGIIRSRKSMDGYTMAKRKRKRGETIFYKTLHKKLKRGLLYFVIAESNSKNCLL
jgi:hypothetical protein